MRYRLSLHAQAQIEQRKLPLQLVQIVLESPQQIVESDGAKVYQSQFDYNNKTQLLRVVVNDRADPALVITIYVTSKISKYWREQ